MKKLLTTGEIDAIRFYEGDVRKRTENGMFSEHKKNKGFFGIEHAYRTMNCLMFDGIDNEIERIREENGELRPELYLKADKVIEVFCTIYRAMCKNAIHTKGTINKFVYRTERGISVQELKKGQTISFTSTSKENKPEEYLQKKTDLTLLEIVFDSKIPHLDFEEILGKDYYYKNQKEILLPPFLEIDLKEVELTQAEQCYRDADNHPPCGKYLVLVKGMADMEWENKDYIENPLASRRKKKAAKILRKMMKKKDLTDEEKEVYCIWKKEIRAIIQKEFQKIQNEYFFKEEISRKELLITDVNAMRKEFNEKRKTYKNGFRWCHFALIITKAIPSVCMALSFVEAIQVGMKIVALITSTFSILLSEVLRVEVYNIKMQQRTKTYLQLCDLSRKMKYESMWNWEKEEQYIQEYRDIMKADMEMSLHNVELQVNNAEALYQDDNKSRQ